MKKLIALAIIILSLGTGRVLAQGIAMRSNLAADAMGIVNLGVDFTLNDQTTMSVTGLVGKTYVPFLKNTFALGGQLEARHWFSHQPYEDFFLGVTATPAIYKMTRKDIEHKGFAIPLGFNFGYSWPINRKLNIEASYGAGLLMYSEFGGPNDNGNVDVFGEDKNYYLDFSTTNFCIGITYILK